MKTFIYLIVWCAIFNKNQSQPTNNHDSKTNTPENVLNEVTTRFWNRPQQLGNENKHNETISNSRVAKREAIEKSPEETKQQKVTELPKSTGITNNSEETPLPSTVPTVSSQTNNENISDNDFIRLPKYGLGLIMFAMVLMFLIIMALLFMLYKIKQDTRDRDLMNVAIEPKNETNYKYSRQLSDEGSNVSTLLKDKMKDSKLLLTRSDSKALFINNLDTIDATKQISPINDIKTSSTNIPESNPSTANERPLTRILKQPSVNHVLITREQMSELCEGVLSKKKTSNETTSLTDLEKFSNELQKGEKENTDLEKSLSTPELDSDMYDVLPTPSPRKFFDNSDGINNDEFVDEIYDNPPKHHFKKSNDSLKKHEDEESDDGVYDNPVSNRHDNEVFDDGIYDNPPTNHNRKRNVVVSTGHEDYVVPLSKDNGLYCNAKDYVDSKICIN